MTSPAPGHVAWERLHPLSPVVRGARAAVPLVVLVVLAAEHRSANGQSSSGPWIEVAVVGAIVLTGLVNWLVTRWSFDGSTLRIETGLVRRDHKQLPVGRIQAVDLAQPLLAKVFGLAELRIRLAGASSESRLAYLSERRAATLRGALLAAHHGLDPATPEPAERPLTVVPTGRLLGSVVLSGVTALTVVVVAGLAVTAVVSEKAAAVVLGFGFFYLLALVLSVVRRFNGQYEFTVAEAPDGIRIRRGMVGTLAETIPLRRVQAIRQVEPLAWRLLGWCRLEVDVAGQPGRGTGPRRVTRTLLPVGPLELADGLRALVVGHPTVTTTRPPRRARAKAPLSYHFLAAGHDQQLAVSVTGRLRKVTCWVPLEKAQSIRRVQGPLQRPLGLATVVLDVAGRDAGVYFKDRDAAETTALLDQLAVLCREARRAAEVAGPLGSASEHAPAASPAPDAIPAGWYPDPSGRYRSRYWDGTAWTDHTA